MANNVMLIPLKAIVTLYHNHNHILVETMKVCFTKKEKLGQIQEIQCNETSMEEIYTTENQLNITHFDKFNNSTRQNTNWSISQVSSENNKIIDNTTEMVKKLFILNKSEKKLIDENEKNEPIENDNFEYPEEYDKYILVENIDTPNVLCDNNTNELNQLMSDYDTVNRRILKQFESNPSYFKSAIKHYTLAMKDCLSSKESLLNALNSFGEQFIEKHN